MTKIFTTTALIFLFCTFAQSQHEYCTSDHHHHSNTDDHNNLGSVLLMSGKNRPELEKAINYFKQSSDSLKYKAICFLIENMDIHYSVDYYWADSLNRHVKFNELNYPTFEESLKAFEELKKHTPGIHPVSVRYRDIDSIKANFLIDNVERAFEVWKRPWTKNLSFELFCEYILPYRVFSEPLQNWRAIYQNRFGWLADSVDNNDNMLAVKALNDNIRKWFVITWGAENNKEPLPILGPLQSLYRKQGLCQNSVCLSVYALRSQGLPCCMDIVPYWATTSNMHYFNETLDEEFNPKGFEGADRNPDIFQLQREPSKVIRITYVKQPDALPSILPMQQIPNGIMRNKNIKDVTSSYWPIKNIECNLFPSNLTQKVAYACVLNGGQWRAAWWGKIENNKVLFKQMARGVVYMPMYFNNGKFFPAGYPIALGYNHEKVLVPDTLSKHTIRLKEQDKYLIYKEDKIYRLFYWNNKWIFIGEKKAETGAYELEFENVPRNALLRLIPEYSKGMERPFIITDEGERIWW